MIKENRYITRKLRQQNKRGEPFPFPLLSSQFRLLLQPNECILSKIHTLSLLCLPTTTKISSAPLSDPLQGITGLTPPPWFV